jgi:septal ring factor EnvC (AmiA/AmiB activator)
MKIRPNIYYEYRHLIKKDVKSDWFDSSETFTGSAKNVKKKSVKKETPNQTKLRLKTEKIAEQKKKITVLNKTIKTLEAEVKALKAQLPIRSDPNDVKGKSDITRRFSTMDLM